MKKIVLSIIFVVNLIPLAKTQTYSKINKENLIIKEWNTDSKTGKKVLDHVTTYSADRKKIEETEYGLSGQKWRKRYEYGQNGKCSKELIYNEHNQLVSYKTFNYNEYGRKSVQYTYDARGKIKAVKNFEYIISDDK